MTRKTALWLLAGGVLVVAVLAWAFAPRAVPVEVVTVAAGPFEAGIDEEARTRLRDRYVISAPLAGRWLRPQLREGDAVRAGDVLGWLQPLLPAMLDARAQREQQARAQAAAAGLEAARARVQQARVGLERARADLVRSESLAQQGFVSQAKAEADRLSQDAAGAELQAAREGERAAGFELELARAALAVGAARAASAANAAAHTEQFNGPSARVAIRAPVSGRVLKLHGASEATVAAGTPLLELGDVGGLEIVAELLTTDTWQVRPGSEVRIDRWGGPQRLEGVVRHVEPGAFTKVSALGVEEQRVRVVIDLRSPAEQWAALGDGYRVSVRVVTRSAEQALKVPVGAVFPRPAGLQADDGCPQPRAGAAAGLDNGCVAAFVVAGGRARLRAVRLEARETREAWVRGGLAAGDQVIVYPAAAVEEGARVAVRTVTGTR